MAIQLTPSEWDRKWWDAYHIRISHNDQQAFARAHQYMLDNWGPKPREAKLGVSKFTIVKLVFRLYSQRRNLMNTGNLIKILAAFFGAIAAQTSTAGIPATAEGWIPVVVAGVTTVLAIFVNPPKPAVK
jgi:hypothetical protein